MRVYHSNRLELLAEDLARLIASDPADPLVPERIVVPHPTMGRWLRLELARELGIAANINTELPAEFAWSILRDAAPSLSKAQGFDPRNLRWHLFDLLPEFSRSQAGEEVRDFLADGDARKRFELADKLAGVFDRCINFREDWIKNWEQGARPHWQAQLWQSLVRKVPEQHWAQALETFRRETASGIHPRTWPTRTFFFGVSAFSPSYLELLRQLGGSIELHIFLFNPCQEFWSDLRTEKESRYRAGEADIEELHFEVGNELLAAWGRAGRDTFDALSEGVEDQDRFPEPHGESRLAAVQRDIQVVRLAAEATVSNNASAEVRQDVQALQSDAEAAGSEDKGADNSLQIHCCHSPMREAEVLHDHLLDLLDSNPEIEPADITILTPNLSRYGPVIAAVFEAEYRIPVVLSRSRAADSPTTRAFFDLLALPGSRYGAEAVLAPLAAPSLRARFRIDESSLVTIRSWIRQAGIRRGVGADDGKQATVISDHTWIEGLRRLLMGYAAGDTDDLVLGVAPSAIRGGGGFDAGEDDYETLGRFMFYCEKAFELPALVGRERSAKQWAEDIGRMLKQFFDDGSTPAGHGGFEAAREVAKEVDEIRTLIENFEKQAGRVDCPIPFEVVRQALKEAAGGPSHGPAQLADGATIGNLASGQILPSRVVCVVGMNGDEFPRNPPRHTFDLVEQDKRRPGDRDVRYEDRFAFLEALLAARTSFIITYTGRDQRDDSEIPPSVVVDELADYLAVRFPGLGGQSEHGEDSESTSASGQTRHPLQPFSPSYFDGKAGLFSYSKTMLDAARILRSGGGTSSNRFVDKLPEPDSSRREVTLVELERFFANTAQGFLRERFGIRLGEGEEAIDEAEPLQLNGLEQYGLREQILTRGNDSGDGNATPETVMERLLANGVLPHGNFGALAYDEAFAQVNALKASLLPHAEALLAEPVRIDLKIGEFRLTGAIPNIVQEQMICWRSGGLRAKDRIAIRLRQLAWMAAGQDALSVTAISRSGQTEISAPDPNHESISSWLEFWWRGLLEPLRFFPESSYVCAEKIAKGESVDVAVAKAREKWRPSWIYSVSPESEDACNVLVWEDGDPLGEDFAQLAQELLLPLTGGTPE